MPPKSAPLLVGNTPDCLPYDAVDLQFHVQVGLSATASDTIDKG